MLHELSDQRLFIHIIINGKKDVSTLIDLVNNDKNIEVGIRKIK